ncbi:aspartic peptidase domain-containing protein [Phaeosphaeriaceae sp. PMI808]|nr:aspartic peptidase domain-containing protein [Phaeosphaeriaceae sp. PMI808]
MFSCFVYFLLSFVTFICSVLGAGCQPRALSLPFKSNRLSTNGEARGISWRVGGPNSQSMSLVPSAWYSDTYLWGPGGFCPNWTTPSSCATYRGGLYDISSSGTKSNVTTMVPHILDNIVANWTKDDVKLADDTSLPQFEFGLHTFDDNPFTQLGELGLGRTSTFLKTLVDNLKISSTSYSFFWGNEVTKQPRDGSLTLGGYDEAIVGNSRNITVPFTEDARCKEGIIVNITSIGLQTRGGGSRDAWDGLPDLRVCVNMATSNIMTIPVEYWDPIQAIMGVDFYPWRNGTSTNYLWNTTIVKPATATYSGNMSMTINNALTVTIPNNQLLFDEHFIERGGFVQTKTDVKQIPIVRIAPGDGMMPRIGGLFFSSAYLMVNHDKKEFTLTEAQPNPAPANIVAFDTKNNCVAPLGGNTTSKSPNAPNDESSPGADNTSPSSGLAGGIIAGIVVGVVGGIALIASFAFIIWRRKGTAYQKTRSELTGDSRIPIEKHGYDVAEMYVEGNELGSGTHIAHELDGSGKPQEMQGSERLSRVEFR